MSQEAFLRALDANLLDALVDAGLGDDAVYTAAVAPASPIACQVLVDHNAQMIELDGDPAPLAAARTVVRLPTAQVANPTRGDSLVVGATTYLLAEPLAFEPGVYSLWAVVRGN